MSIGSKDKSWSYHACAGGEGLRPGVLSQSCSVALLGMIQIMPHMSFISCRDSLDAARDLMDALHQLPLDLASVLSSKNVFAAFSTMAC